MFFLDGKFLSGCLCTLKSKKPKKPKKPKNLKTFSKKPRFFPALDRQTDNALERIDRANCAMCGPWTLILR